jgi:hypothetical protein
MMILGAVKLMQPVHGYDVRRELLSWHADKWAKVQPGSVYLWGQHEGEDPFIAALSFLTELPREEASAALRSRAKALRAINDGVRNAYTSGWAAPSNKPTNVRWMLELLIARQEGEILWCERVADEIDSGVPYVSEELAGRWSEGWSHQE